MRIYLIGGAVVLALAATSNLAFDLYDHDGPWDEWEEWVELVEDGDLGSDRFHDIDDHPHRPH